MDRAQQRAKILRREESMKKKKNQSLLSEEIQTLAKAG